MDIFGRKEFGNSFLNVPDQFLIERIERIHRQERIVAVAIPECDPLLGLAALL